MGRKKVLKIPKSALIRCVKCGKNSRVNIPQDSCIYFYECKKCKAVLETPTSQCCVICAYTNKKCPPLLIREFNSR